MKKRNTLWLFVCAVLSACGAGSLAKTDITILTQEGSKVPLRVELAVTEAEQSRGYMRRTSIPEGTGMLFVFNSDRIAHFWMKDTPSPLSIAYIDSSGIIRDIFGMTPYSLASVSSSVSVRYALEVPHGWFKKEGIKTGDRLVLPPEAR